jgi:YtfJ family uncharacterized protein
MRSWIAALAALLGLPGVALAEPEVGDVLPALALEDCGEMALAGDEISYHTWDHAGSPLLLHFIAARVGVDRQNTGVLKNVLDQRPALRPLTVTLLNTKDTTWGLGRLIKGIVERRKRELPHARLVLDCEGLVGEAWSLPEKASVLMLLDADGTVRFVQVGMTPAERVPVLLAAVDALELPAQPDAEASQP